MKTINDCIKDYCKNFLKPGDVFHADELVQKYSLCTPIRTEIALEKLDLNTNYISKVCAYIPIYSVKSDQIWSVSIDKVLACIAKHTREHIYPCPFGRKLTYITDGKARVVRIGCRDIHLLHFNIEGSEDLIRTYFGEAC